MAQYLGPAFQQALSASAVPYSGGLMYVYEPGTTTLVSLFSDEDMLTPAANPMVADSSGSFTPVFLTETSVKLVLQTSTGSTVRTIDPVYTTGVANVVAGTDVTYNGTSSGLASENVQEAIDEVVALQGSSQTWTSASDGPIATGTSTNTGAAGGPDLDLYRVSASPAASDIIGGVRFSGENAAADKEIYAKVHAVILDTTNGSEDGKIVVQTMVAGALNDRMHVGSGAWMNGATGGDKGAGSFNATTVYEANSRVLSAATYAATTVYSGSDADNIDFPVGTCLFVNVFSDANRNATATIRLGGGSSVYTTGGSGTVLTGTWRARGAGATRGGSGDQLVQMFQRTA